MLVSAKEMLEKAVEGQHRPHLDLIASQEVHRQLLHAFRQAIIHILRRLIALQRIGKRNHALPGIKRNLVVCFYIEETDVQNPFDLQPFICGTHTFRLDPGAAVTDLQDFPLAFLQFNTVRYAAFGVIPYQEAFQTHLFSLRMHSFKGEYTSRIRSCSSSR